MSHFDLNDPFIEGPESHEGCQNNFDASNASIEYSLLKEGDETFLGMSLSTDHQNVNVSEWLSEGLALVFKEGPLYFRLPAGFEIAAEDFSRIHQIKFIPNADMSSKKYVDMEALTNFNESMIRIISFLRFRFSDPDLMLMGIDANYLVEESLEEEWEREFYQKTGMHC